MNPQRNGTQKEPETRLVSSSSPLLLSLSLLLPISYWEETASILGLRQATAPNPTSHELHDAFVRTVFVKDLSLFFPPSHVIMTRH